MYKNELSCRFSLLSIYIKIHSISEVGLINKPQSLHVATSFQSILFINTLKCSSNWISTSVSSIDSQCGRNDQPRTSHCIEVSQYLTGNFHISPYRPRSYLAQTSSIRINKMCLALTWRKPAHFHFFTYLMDSNYIVRPNYPLKSSYFPVISTFPSYICPKLCSFIRKSQVLTYT